MLLRLWPEKTAVSFMSLRFVALVISVIALLASAALLSSRGLNLGIDFAGGAVLEIDKPEDVSADQIRDTVTSLVTGDVQVNSARGTGPNAPEIAVIRFEPQPPVGDETPDEAQNRAGDVVSAAMRDLIEAARSYYIERDSALAEVERLLTLDEEEINEAIGVAGEGAGSVDGADLHGNVAEKR